MSRNPFPGAVSALIELLSPQRCPLCGRPSASAGHPLGVRPPGLRPWDRPYLCDACVADLVGDAAPPHRRIPSSGGILLAGGVVSHGTLVGLVGDFKYHGMRGLAAPLGRITARALDAARGEGCAVDLLVPVPLHTARLRSRGFNQARLLAEVVGLLADVPVRPDLLRRTRNTPQQARISASDDRERASNVAASFAAESPSGAAGTVALVDDLITTGATTGAAAEALAAAGWTVSCALGIGLSCGD